MCTRFITTMIVVLGLAVGLVQAELVAHWTFDEGSGSIAHDYSGNGNDGTLEGDAQWVAGWIGAAIEFNGSNARVVAPHIPLNNQSFTVTMWVNPVLYTNQQTVFSQVQTNDTNTSLHFRLGGPGGTIPPPGAIRMGFYSNDLDAPDGLIEDNNWYHITFWYDFENQNRRIYVDGEQVAEATATPYLGASGSTVIGSWGTGEWFRGIIDDVRVYDHPLSEGEIQGAMKGEAWPYALGPKPGNGDVIDATSATLEWRPGGFAALHDVYFGESIDEVSAATPDDANVYVGRQATEMLSVGMAGGPAPDGLVPGETYYWRVDEVNDVEPNSPWKGEVWSFRVRPLVAWNPGPADGVLYVGRDQDLTWEPGMNVLFHTVYFGESFDEVSEAVAGGMMLTGLTLDPGPLAADTTYYWRVDEFTFPGSVTYKGDVWSFTTVPEIPVTDPDLVGWWTFDEGVGLTAVDWSGHGNHGTMLGDPQWVDGYFGDALAFDGSGAYVDCRANSAFNIGTNITVMCWIKVQQFNKTWQAIVTQGDDSWRLHRSGDTNNIAWGTSGLTPTDITGSVNVNNGEWHHVAGVYDGTQKILYVDGSIDASSNSTGSISNSSYSVNIGENAQATGRYWDGLIDDVRVYSKALTEAEIAEVMRGNPLLAGNPEPGPGAVVDIRDATALRWSPGETAASHDVYFGTDRGALELQGNQPGTSFSLAGLVEFGGGDYFWRIDEVEADATTIHEGYTWRFTIPDYLIVDDFESYDDDWENFNRIFQVWIDGAGYTAPAPGHPGNGSGSLVGTDLPPWVEHSIVHGGGQSMPIQYDNTVAPGISEADRTFTPAQDWTAQGVTTLVIHFRGDAANTGDLYVKINGTKVPYDGDPADIASRQWIAWEIDLASVGVNLTSVTTLTIGIEGGGTGIVYVDDIWLTK